MPPGSTPTPHPKVELITIGSEILLGAIVDTNAAHVARALLTVGLEMQRKVSVADDVAVIAGVIAEAAARADVVLTTGGLGPTADDPTREAVALALGRPLEFRPELWDQVRARFRAFGRRPTDNNRQQAYLPAGALALENPIGTAPAFIAQAGGGAVIALPGVPREMEVLLAEAVLPWLRQRFGLRGVRLVRVLHTAGAGESAVDERVRDLEALEHPRLGLAAHAGQVDLRLTAHGASSAEAMAAIAPVEAEIRRRLGGWVYGADGETLAGAVLAGLAAGGRRLAVLDAGLGGQLAGMVAAEPLAAEVLLEARVLASSLDGEALAAASAQLVGSLPPCDLIAASLVPDEVSRQILVRVSVAGRVEERSLRHGGPPAHAPRRAAAWALDLARGMGQTGGEI